MKTTMFFQTLNCLILILLSTLLLLYSHLHRSSHIGEFIITSEEAIAKGIRRIIAITGPDAVKARKHGESLETACKILKNALELNTLSKESALSAINQHLNEISEASIAYYKKDELRNLLKNLKKKIDDTERAGKNEQILRVVDETKGIINHSGNIAFIVTKLNAGSNTKALDAALKQVKQSLPQTAAMFFSTDETNKKICCLCNVPANLIQLGLRANEWVNNISSIMGGKGGGKEDAAQASGTKYDVINEVIAISTEYANLKLKISSCNLPCITYDVHNPASILPAVVLQYSGIKVQEYYDRKLSYVDKNLKLTDPTAIAFLLSNQELKGESHLAEAQIIQWISYVESTIYPAVWSIISSGKDKNINQVKNATEMLVQSLDFINGYLQNYTYFVGERITLADISIFARILPVFHNKINVEKKRLINLTRWFNTIQNQPQVQNVISNGMF